MPSGLPLTPAGTAACCLFSSQLCPIQQTGAFSTLRSGFIHTPLPDSCLLATPQAWWCMHWSQLCLQGHGLGGSCVGPEWVQSWSIRNAGSWGYGSRPQIMWLWKLHRLWWQYPLGLKTWSRGDSSCLLWDTAEREPELDPLLCGTQARSQEYG